MEKIGACIADPFANGEGGEIKGYVHLPQRVQAAGVSTLLQFGARLGVMSTENAAANRMSV
jgi:hypothetical protein